MEDLKETNTLLYHTALELDRYQDMTQEVLDYIEKHKDIKEVNDIYDIIKNGLVRFAIDFLLKL